MYFYDVTMCHFLPLLRLLVLKLLLTLHHSLDLLLLLMLRLLLT